MAGRAAHPNPSRRTRARARARCARREGAGGARGARLPPAHASSKMYLLTYLLHEELGQAPGSPGAVTRSARLAALHRAPSLYSTFAKTSESRGVAGFFSPAREVSGALAFQARAVGRPALGSGIRPEARSLRTATKTSRGRDEPSPTDGGVSCVRPELVRSSLGPGRSPRIKCCVYNHFHDF